MLSRQLRWGSLTPNKKWTASVLTATAAQRGATFLSTLFYLRFVGAVEFEEVVPLMPIAPLVAAMSTVGQDQAALRTLLSAGGRRLRIGAAATTAAIVIGAGALLGLALALLVSMGFSTPLAATSSAALGGVLLAIAQATSISQIRATRSGRAYVAVFLAYGGSSFAARVWAEGYDVGHAQAWAIGDVVGGLAALGVALALSSPGLRTGTPVDLGANLRFGLPFLPHTLAQQMMGNADRWIFTGRVPASALAVYVAAYQVANLVSVALAEVNRSRQHLYVNVPAPDTAKVERQERRTLLTIVAITAIPLPIISAAASGQEFVASFGIALGICLSFTPLAWYLPRANIFSLTLGRTGALATASISGAIVSVATSVALVSSLGTWAGVVANVLSFLTMYLVLSRTPRSL